MFFSLPNNTSIVVSKIAEPWNYKSTLLPQDLVDAQSKQAYRKWCTNPATQHAFISGVEGMDPNRRASWDEGNPPHKLHGLIVDYDADNQLTDAALDDIRNGTVVWPSEFAPQWVADSYSKGHLRVLWLFEAPVLLASDKHYTKFVQLLDKKLRFNKWFSGFEAEALGDACKYYMIGSNYRPVKPDMRLSKALLDLWSFEAAKQVQDTLIDTKYKIPLERVAEEVQGRFPGRWSGPFEVGARGVRFWDPTAQDTTGCIVLDNGMMAFSGEQAFIPWVKIFGTAFVEKFEADKISKVMDKVVFELKQGAASSSYWVDNGGNWTCMNLGQVKMWLECHGFSDKRGKDATASEITRVLNEVHLNRCVTGAFPYIMHPHGIIERDGRKILNTSTIKAFPPAPEGLCQTLSEGRSYFPMLWSFISGFFERVEDHEHSPNIQLEFFLTWLQHAYKLYYKMTPQPGLILIMAGAAGAGKSFMLQRVISKILGGSHDMKDTLAATGTTYTDLLTQKPVAYVDDMSEITEADQHRKYSERIKALVSNHQITFNGKWKATGETLWYGRVVICMNDDANSLRMLPDMSVSIADKVAMLKIENDRTDGHKFSGNWAETERKVEAELPFFCRWLLDGWKVPEYLENRKNPRYYVLPFKHHSLYKEANQRGSKHELFEILTEFVADMHSTGNEEFKAKGWNGTATTLYALLTSGRMESVVRKWSPARLGTALGLLTGSTDVRRMHSHGNLSVWHIPSDFRYLSEEEMAERKKPKNKKQEREERELQAAMRMARKQELREKRQKEGGEFEPIPNDNDNEPSTEATVVRSSLDTPEDGK